MRGTYARPKPAAAAARLRVRLPMSIRLTVNYPHLAKEVLGRYHPLVSINKQALDFCATFSFIVYFLFI